MMNRRDFMKSVALLVAAGKRLPDLLTRKAVPAVEEAVSSETWTIEEGDVNKLRFPRHDEWTYLGEPMYIMVPTNDISEPYERIYVGRSESW